MFIYYAEGNRIELAADYYSGAKKWEKTGDNFKNARRYTEVIKRVDFMIK